MDKGMELKDQIKAEKSEREEKFTGWSCQLHVLWGESGSTKTTKKRKRFDIFLD